jgi:hypothetical protein
MVCSDSTMAASVFTVGLHQIHITLFDSARMSKWQQCWSHLTSLFVRQVGTAECRKWKTRYRVSPHGITSLPNFIQIYPADLELNHADRQTGQSACIHFLQFMQWPRKKLSWLYSIWITINYFEMGFRWCQHNLTYEKRTLEMTVNILPFLLTVHLSAWSKTM